MQPNRRALKTLTLTALIALAPYAIHSHAADDQAQVARNMIKTLEAYAVYKMGQYDLAFERYLELAEKGNRQGMMNVANMYAEGKGVPQNDGKAFQWYLRLAETGDRIGMEAAAAAYRSGQGVEMDTERARYWELLSQEKH